MGDIYFVALPFIHPAGETMDSAEHGEAMVLGYKAEERDRGRVQSMDRINPKNISVKRSWDSEETVEGK